MKKKLALALTLALFGGVVYAQRSERRLEKNWKFAQEEVAGAASETFNDKAWKEVQIPHDWAIFGPFDRNHDLQHVAVTQNFETQASVKTERTGGIALCGSGMVPD